MHSFDIRPHVDKIFLKLRKKNPKQLKIIYKKIAEILQNPNRYKNLRKPMQHLKAVHVDKQFVLTFSVHNSKNLVIIEDFDHHDNIYK